MARIARVATFSREENVNTYLQGRKITATQDYERPSVEALHLIRKLRWIGMEEEAERAETQLHETTARWRCHHGRARNRLGARF